MHMLLGVYCRIFGNDAYAKTFILKTTTIKF
jgi:hypothetical protein